MKFLKTTGALLLAFAMIFCLTGCSALQATIEGTISNLGESVLNQANPDSSASEDSQSAESGTTNERTVLSDSTESIPAGDSESDSAERYTEDSLRDTVKKLVEGGFGVCEVYYNGVSFTDEPVKDADGNATSWYPVNDERFASIDDMKAFAEQYYTPAFAQAALYSVAFEGDYPKYSMQNGVLCINNDVGGLGWGIEWEYDTMTITSQTENSVTLQINAKLYDEDDGTHTLVLTKANGEWRLDSTILG